MFRNKSHGARRGTAIVVGGLVGCMWLLACTEPALAIPTFSRKYRTSCITCHSVFPKLTDVGEAFRRNGYQFPQDDDILVKDEPIPFGSEAYKEMWPNSVWPSDLPGLPPVFIRAQLREQFHTDPGPDGLKWRQDMPHEIVLGGAGTFGKNISAWWEIEWEPHELEAEVDGDEVDFEEFPINVERAFVQFSNLFAWEEEEDENGMHLGNRWLVLPPHAMNLRIGRMEPGVLPHYWSVHSRPGIEQYLHQSRSTGNGANGFKFEGAQSAAVELHGIIRQYNSYVVGFANGGLVATQATGGHVRDDNNHKDVYFRLARKWFGYPLDGVLGAAESDADMEVRGQSSDEEVYSPGLDWWRALGLETGLFGWWGRAKIAQPNGETGEDFQRLGADARLQWFDLDLMGMFMFGHDDFGGDPALMGEDFYLWGLEADYMVKPWMLTYCRYEELNFNEAARQAEEEGRVVLGAVCVIRQNLKAQGEWVLDTTGMDTGGRTSTDELRFQLDYAY